MGRVISSGGVSGGSGSSSTPALSTVLTTGEAVQASQILALAGDGNCYYVADPANTAAAVFRPMYQAAAATGVSMGEIALGIGSGYIGGSPGYSRNQNAAKLANGNYVVLGSASGGGSVKFTIRTALGAVVKSATVATTDTTNNYAAVVALIGGGFAIAYQTSTGVIAFITFDANGAQTGTQTTTSNVSTAPPCQLVALSNGSFAVNFITSGTTNSYLAIYSSVCAVILAPTKLNAAGSPQLCPAICALSGGGLAVHYLDGGVGSYSRYVVYSNAGAVVKAATNIIQPTNGGQTPSIVALPGGGFAIAINETASATAGLHVATYDAAGNIQGAVTSLDAAAANGQIPMCVDVVGGGWYVMWLSGGNAKVAKFTAAGAQIGTTITLASVAPSGAGTSYQWALFSAPDGSCVAILPNGSGSALSAAQISSSLVQGTTFNFTSTGGLSFVDIQAAGTYAPTSMTFTIVSLGVSMNTWAFTLQKSIVIGMSLASAAANSAVPVQYTGNATLATAFAQPYAFDGNTLSPPGQRLNVVGNSIMLGGIQPAARRPIN